MVKFAGDSPRCHRHSAGSPKTIRREVRRYLQSNWSAPGQGALIRINAGLRTDIDQGIRESGGIVMTRIEAKAMAGRRGSCAAQARSTMKVLFILNDSPYGTERVYNAPRVAHALVGRDASAEVSVFLMVDAVLAAKAHQRTPEGYYNVERILNRVLTGKVPGGSAARAWTCVVLQKVS